MRALDKVIERVLQSCEAFESREAFDDRCRERLARPFKAILERYQSLFDLWRRSGHSGRPYELLREPKRASGRPLNRVAAHVVAVATRERRRIPVVARELFLEVMKQRNPARYRQLEQRLFQLEGEHSRQRATTRLFSESKFRAEEKQLDSLIRTSRNHLHGGPSQHR